MKHFAAVIFDMDGLLLDTERVALESFEEACRQLHLSPPPREVFNRCLGINKEASNRVLEEGLRGVVDPDVFRKTWDAAHWAQVERDPPRVKAGAVALLRHLAALGVPAAVATSTSTARARVKLEDAGLLPHFTEVVGGDQVRRSKPHPDIYLRAAQRVAVQPAACLALEDSENGVRAAVAAGMRVVQIPDLVLPSRELRGLGHTVLSGLEEVLTYPFGPGEGGAAPEDAAVTIALERPDQEEVLRLIDALDAYQKPLYPPESFHGIDLAELQRPNVLFAVARESGRAVGCAAVVMVPAYGEIKRMFVLPGHRGRRIGARLLEFVEATARRAGCRRFVLKTGIHQHEALAAYARAGYERCAPFGEYLPDPMSVFMDKLVPA